MKLKPRNQPKEKIMAMNKEREALVKRLRVYARHSSQAVAHDLLAAADALTAHGGEQTADLLDPLRFLVELKHIKRRIEAGTATESEAAFYEANKETAWLNAERALAATRGGEQSAVHEALHASAPTGYKCADCTMDKEPCPVCYSAWWKIKHPHTIQHAIGQSADMVSVPSDKDNPVVGHKTLQNGMHIPLRKDEADALIAQVRLSEKQRRAAMPDEKSAINTLFNAWLRLKDFGWRDIDYCPKDGSSFLALECGSTGIHNAHYQGDQFKGSIWIESNGDLWPSEPVLFKPAATKEGK